MRPKKTVKNLVKKGKAGSRLIGFGERAPIATIGLGVTAFSKMHYKPIGLAIMVSSPFIKNYVTSKGMKKHEEVLLSVMGRPRIASAVRNKTKNPNVRLLFEIFGNANPSQKKLLTKIAKLEANEKEIESFAKLYAKTLRQSKDPGIRKLFYFKRGARGINKELIERKVREAVRKELIKKVGKVSNEKIMESVGEKLNKVSVEISAQNVLDIYSINDSAKRKRIMNQLTRVFDRQLMLEKWGKSERKMTDSVIVDAGESVLNEFPTRKAGKNFINTYNKTLSSLIDIMPNFLFSYLEELKITV